jgi:hypothetical protein
MRSVLRTEEVTPYRGFVMGVAQDTTGTYLLYLDPIRDRVGGSPSGLPTACTPPADCLSGNWASSTDTQGDVVATGGRRSAVWTEFVEATGRPIQMDLFQAEPPIAASGSLSTALLH